MRIGALLGVTVALAACSESPAAPSRTLIQPGSVTAVVSEERLTLPASRTFFVGCANNGAGENVELNGEIELRIFTWQDDDGGLRESVHARPSHMAGVGELTGAKYKGVGNTISHERYYPDGTLESDKFVNILRVIGQGPGNNFHVHMMTHQTFDENGQVKHDAEFERVECK